MNGQAKAELLAICEAEVACNEGSYSRAARLLKLPFDGDGMTIAEIIEAAWKAKNAALAKARGT